MWQHAIEKEREKYVELKKAKYQINLVEIKAQIEYLGPKSNRNWTREHKRRNSVANPCSQKVEKQAECF